MKHCSHWNIDGIFCCKCDDYSVTGKVKQIMPDKCSLEVDSHLKEIARKNIGQIALDLNKQNRNFSPIITIPKLDKPSVTLNLDGDSIDKYTPLTIRLDGESITLEHEDIKDLFYREKERKITKLIDFMRDNNFEEKDISGVISNLRNE